MAVAAHRAGGEDGDGDGDCRHGDGDGRHGHGGDDAVDARIWELIEEV